MAGSTLRRMMRLEQLGMLGRAPERAIRSRNAIHDPAAIHAGHPHGLFGSSGSINRHSVSLRS
jgi:hypothetical protein